MPVCEYPTCRLQASVVPVIAIPTYRTVGLHKPTLNRDLVNNPVIMGRAQLNRNIVIDQYEKMTDEYKANVNKQVETDKPTYLIGVPLCTAHQKNYKFTDWFQPKDWRLIQEAGRERGYVVPEPHLLVIHWRPLGWQPNRGYLEIER